MKTTFTIDISVFAAIVQIRFDSCCALRLIFGGVNGRQVIKTSPLQRPRAQDKLQQSRD